MSNEVNVVVSNGVVVDVKGLPEGWDVTITDVVENGSYTYGIGPVDDNKHIVEYYSDAFRHAKLFGLSPSSTRYRSEE